MVNKLLTVFILLFSLQTSSQEDILGEWFLYSITESDIEYVNNNLHYMNLVFTDESDYYYFEGNAVCNTYFSSTTAIDGNTFTAFPPGWTLVDCHEHEEYSFEQMIHNLFELNYDGVNPVIYEYYIDDSPGTGYIETLVISNEQGNYATFGRQPMIPNPLIGEWYLYSLEENGETILETTSQDIISIVFSEDIENDINDLTINGICGSHESTYLTPIFENSFRNFNQTWYSNATCTEDNQGFDMALFNLFNPLVIYYPDPGLIGYTITDSGDNELLEIYQVYYHPHGVYTISGYFGRQSLNLQDFEDLSNIQLFPNPAAKSITIDLNSSITNEIFYSIFSIDGKEIENNRLNNKTINISKLTSGLYFIKLSTENQTTSIKFIKK